jgi:hypothetical protein
LVKLKKHKPSQPNVHASVQCNETVWEHHCLSNQPTDEFIKSQSHFQLNWDKTCVMACITTGNLYIVGSAAAVKKHEKTTNDNKGSITLV